MIFSATQLGNIFAVFVCLPLELPHPQVVSLPLGYVVFASPWSNLDVHTSSNFIDWKALRSNSLYIALLLSVKHKLISLASSFSIYKVSTPMSTQLEVSYL